MDTSEFTDEQIKALQALADGYNDQSVSRRDVMKLVGASSVGALLGGGGMASAVGQASAGTQQVGGLGEPGNPIDLKAVEDIYGPGGQGSGDPVNFEAVNTEQLQSAQNNIGFSGRLSGRPMVTESETILTVGTNTATIQEALNQIPRYIRHNFEIQVPDGDYSGEDLLVPPFTVADDAGLNRDDVTNEGASHLPRITGNINTPTNVQVGSITVTGTQGAIAPLIEGFNVVGYAPYSDEDPGIAVYGCQNVSFRWISFANNTTARVGFLPYSSGVTIRQECDLGAGNLLFGVETKHNANVTLDHFAGASYSLTGSATDYAIYNNDGCVVTYNHDDGFNATGGTRDVYNREGVMYNAGIHEYEPAVGVRATSSVVDQSIPSEDTVVQFDGTVYDRRGDFDAANNRFVAPLGGRYHIEAQVQWLNPGDTTELELRVIDRVGPKGNLAASRTNGSVHTNPTQSVSTIHGLDEGSAVELTVKHNEGSSIPINTDNDTTTYLAINRLS